MRAWTGVARRGCSARPNPTPNPDPNSGPSPSPGPSPNPSPKPKPKPKPNRNQARLLGTFDERPKYKQLDELVRIRQKEAAAPR
jgi:hypothetical protein